ncbi:hypothetical protein [Pseudogracilibacillus sp. SO10305]|uniref:hypothetical protein n=1 Tax=Pseudogracilibacillus sp. SO10305 TaxID=3098292 RepID=UPI00300E3A2A
MNNKNNSQNMFLTNASVDKLCLVASIHLLFEEENYWTVVIKPDMHELLNGYFFNDYMSFHIPKNMPNEQAKVERYFDTVINKQDLPTEEKFIFVFTKRSRDDGFTNYWHFDFLLKPNRLLEILNPDDSGFSASDG